MNVLKSRWAIILLGLILLIPIIVLLLPRQDPSTRGPLIFPTPTAITVDTTSDETISVIQTIPSEDQINADYTGGITIVFDKPVSAKNVRVQTSPFLDGTVMQLSNTSVKFQPKNELKKDTSYSISISVDSKTLIAPNQEADSDYTWSFKTDTPTGEEAFTKEDVENFQRGREIAENDYQQRKAKFPFIIYLPYNSAHFKVEINSSDTIIITTFESSLSQRQTYRDEALTWIRSRGGTTENLSITYLSSQN